MNPWRWIDEFTKLSISSRYFFWEDTLLRLIGVIIGIIILCYLAINERIRIENDFIE